MNILINVEHCHYKLEQYSRQECVKIEGIPQDVTTKNLEDTVIKIFEKLEYQSTSAWLLPATD